MQQHISKAITRQSAAIQMALEHYNKLAPKQSPPRPILKYVEIAGYGWLREFELLRCNHPDIVNEPWTIPSNREMRSWYYKVKATHSEIHCLNVEIPHLQAWITYEH